MIELDPIRLPNVTDDEGRTVNMLLAQLKAKEPRNWLRASYYDGRRAIHQVGSVIPPQYFMLGLVLGWSGKAVDILARRCNLEQFVWPDGDLDSLGYQDLFDRNHLRTRVSGAMVSSLLHGTSFLVNTKGDESEGEPPAMIHVKDALSATGQWNDRAYRLDNLLSITNRDDEGKVTGLALYLNNLTIIADKDRVSGKWSVDKQDHPWGVPAEPMVYKPRPGRPFGSSRISRVVMSLHDQGLRCVIRLEGHADVYSYPEMWMLGADANIFKNADGSPKAEWKVMLGRIKGIPDDEDASTPRADVKQFPASSPEPHLAQLNALAKMFAREASLPDTSVAITDVSNPTSGESYDASQYELIAEAEGAIDDWGLPLRRAQTRALAMANNLDEVPAEWSSIREKFRDARYQSRAAQADAGLKQLTAMPWLADTEVGMELLGLDDQQIKRALSERRRNGGSAALRAITSAVSARTAPVAAEPVPAEPVA